MAMTPIPGLDRTSATFRTDVDVFFGERVPRFVSEANAMQANLSSLLTGGAYSLPYIYGQDRGAGKLGVGIGVNQIYTDYVYLNRLTAAGIDFTSTIDEFDNSTSAIKGKIRLMCPTDPTKWILYNVIGSNVVVPDGFAVKVSATAYSAFNPFVEGDVVVLHFQRTGDKGDGTAVVPTLYLRDVRPQGTNGQSLAAGSNIRSLNTTQVNSIPQASLVNNQALVPPGTYNIFARASAYGVNAHRIALWSITDGALFELGSSEFALDTGVENKSFLEVRNYTITSSKTFELRHYVSTSNATYGGGRASNLGGPEVYAELIFEKVG
jgi:hypothetical protein